MASQKVPRESKQNELLQITESAVQALTKQHQNLGHAHTKSHLQSSTHNGGNASVVSKEDTESNGSSSTTASKVLINSTGQVTKLEGESFFGGSTSEIQTAHKVWVPARVLNEISSPGDVSLLHDEYVVDESDEKVVNISLAKRQDRLNVPPAAVSREVRNKADARDNGAVPTRTVPSENKSTSDSDADGVGPTGVTKKKGDAHPLMVMLDSGYLTQPIRTVVAEETAASRGNSDSPIVVHARDMELSQSESGK
jgi:hypothetical protein